MANPEEKPVARTVVQRKSAVNKTDTDIRRNFCKNLMRIEVPVTVMLAQKQMPLERITSLVPGMMIQFDLNCDSPLKVEVDEQPIAEGEIVKVGDKFGIRISEILDRGELFHPLVKTNTV
jgi:flagellar motor switch protein FliN/FliY